MPERIAALNRPGQPTLPLYTRPTAPGFFRSFKILRLSPIVAGNGLRSKVKSLFGGQNSPSEWTDFSRRLLLALLAFTAFLAMQGPSGQNSLPASATNFHM